jgi:hypothetical protein
MRDINDILNFRTDISPFLVHLTKPKPRPFPHRDRPAHYILEKILEERSLVAGQTSVSDARFGMYTADLNDDERRELFGAICFTETPISEIHNLLEIEGRAVDLSPYGLVFLKEQLQSRGVSPVLYFNNFAGDKDPIFQALCGLVETDRDAALEVLPLMSVFGERVRAPGAQQVPPGIVDFRWEREWRRPSARGPLEFDEEDIFIGLCAHKHIDRFEAVLPEIGFIDPRRNMKWYATKLIKARQRCDLKVSVV